MKVSKEQLSRLQGMQLSDLSVGANTIDLNFMKYPIGPDGRLADEGAIDIEEGFDIEVDHIKHTFIQNDTGERHLHGGVPYLLKLIGRVIADADVDAANCLTISFDNGARIRVLSSALGFDSYEVRLRQSGQ